jgi:hypothetical protein
MFNKIKSVLLITPKSPKGDLRYLQASMLMTTNAPFRGLGVKKQEYTS